MSQEAEEYPGTGLKDVFDILVKAPQERLQSLTYKLGESTEDIILHALCLIILQRAAPALNKLQTLGDSYLANKLAEKWQMSGGKLDDFVVHCGHFNEFTAEALVTLARMFKVLSEEGLCDPPLRNLAYKRALSTEGQKTNSREDVEYNRLKEEAKAECGPRFTEMLCSFRDFKLGFGQDVYSSPNEGNKTLKMSLSKDEPKPSHSLPSPLHAGSSVPSYPTHLEISPPPTAIFQEEKITQGTSGNSKPSTAVTPDSEHKVQTAVVQCQSSEEPQLKSSDPQNAKMDAALSAMGSEPGGHRIRLTNPTTEPATRPKCTPPSPSNVTVSQETLESKHAEDEEEATFYTFVILHAPEDADAAESFKDRIESVTSGKGATFAEEFAIPGKSTLTSVEDAISNSAYTLLLLTHNFDTCGLLEVKANSALINSIHNKHKRDTVIPLLPRENCISKDSIPLVLRTLNMLEENRHFERRIQKALSRARIKTQREVWEEEQRAKTLREKKEKLKLLNLKKKKANEESRRIQQLEWERLMLSRQHSNNFLGPMFSPPEHGGGDGRDLWQRAPNIHIENAQYIMIGNDSQMSVEHVGADRDDFIHREEQ